MNTNIRKILLVLGIMALVVWGEPGAWSADTAQVSCTVTAQKIAVSVSSGSIAYGTVALGSSQDTITLGNTQTATNEGNVAEDFGIEGVDTTSWLLKTATGTDEYVHEISTDSGSSWHNIASSSYYSFATSVAANATSSFDLRLWVPSSTSDYDEQSPNVTIQASASS